LHRIVDYGPCGISIKFRRMFFAYRKTTKAAINL
jgi:hypothetical protein